MTSDSAIGISTGPMERNGCPKARTLEPSTQVTVPEAATVMSPEIKIVATEEPGWRGCTAGAAGSGFREEAPPGTGRNRPPERNASAAGPPGASPGENESGSGSGAHALAAAFFGKADSRRARNRSIAFELTIEETKLAADCGAAPAEVPIGTGAVAGTWRMSSMEAIGVIPAIGSEANGHP